MCLRLENVGYLGRRSRQFQIHSLAPNGIQTFHNNQTYQAFDECTQTVLKNVKTNFGSYKQII